MRRSAPRMNARVAAAAFRVSYMTTSNHEKNAGRSGRNPAANNGWRQNLPLEIHRHKTE